jgi:cupin superfamily acireductone dioxygenase involved in methionine salvage
MIFGKKKRKQIRQNIVDNLTLCRIEGDLLAVEAAIRDNAPKEANEEGGAFKKFFNGMINDINNSFRRQNVEELSVDKAKAQEALKAFRAAHSKNNFEISRDTEKFGKYIDKHLFKKDKDGLSKLSFALIFALDGRNNEYQCPEESLEVVSEILFDDAKRLGRLYNRYRKNYEAIHQQWPSEAEGIKGVGRALALAIMPLCVSGILATVSYAMHKKNAKEAFKNMTLNETNASLAFYLTLIEEMKNTDEGKKKEMVDELLTKVSNIRSDAEYKWYVEGLDVSECKAKIELCNMTLKRLGQILGI